MLRNKTVMFADSNRTFLMLVGVLMKRLGLGFVSASSGDEALRLYSEERPDLVVLDSELAGLSGSDVLRELGARTGKPQVPVIVVSEDASPETREECISLGCTGYLTKPLIMRELHDAIQDALFTKHGTNRKNLRIDTSLRVEVMYDDKVTNLYTETVSEGGVYLKSDSPIPVGKDVRIRFNIEGHGPLEVLGNVIYSKRLAGDNLDIPPGSAVQFSEMDEEKSEAINGLVSRLIAGDIISAQDGEYLSN